MMPAVKDSATNPEVPAGGVRRLRVGEDSAGQRIDNFLVRELKGVPKTRVYRLLRKGEVRVNGGRIDAAYRLALGDEVRIPPVRQGEGAAPSQPAAALLERVERSVLVEDEQLLVLNKPAGIAVHGGSGIAHGVIEALRVLRPKAPFLELVHRLDRETSGCLLIAKRRSALRQLHELLRNGGFEKRYLALLAGKLPRGAIPVEVALDRTQVRGGERMVEVSSEGKHARSVFRAVQRFPGATLAEVEIATGRTHQIRVHAAHLGHPVIGDDKYGDREVNKAFRAHGLKRLFLHAHSLRVHWPDRPPLEVSAPLTEDLEQVLARMSAPAKEQDRG